MGKTGQNQGELWPKNFFLTNAKPSSEVLQGNQWYQEMRLVILQILLGVSGSQLKTGGSFGPKSVTSPMCRAFHGDAGAKPMGRPCRFASSLRIFVAGSGPLLSGGGKFQDKDPLGLLQDLKKRAPPPPWVTSINARIITLLDFISAV